jgi:hypothetical protein
LQCLVEGHDFLLHRPDQWLRKIGECNFIARLILTHLTVSIEVAVRSGDPQGPGPWEQIIRLKAC